MYVQPETGAAPPRYLPSGTRLGGWVLDWPLGEGASGVVYRCRPAEGDGPARALKLLRVAGDPVSRARFAREVEVLRRLEHPAIVPLVEAGETDGSAWLVMALAPGRPLAAVSSGAPVAASFALEVCAQVADALAYAHAHGVTHRDVKPGNVLVDAHGQAVLVDFGIAAAAEASRLTRTGERSPTTPRYAPPEWWPAAPAAPEKADVYALGVVLYELLAGRPAWSDVLPEHLAERKADGPLDPGPGVPAPVRALVREMTAPAAAERPTAREVVARLPRPRRDDAPARSDQTLDAVVPRAPSLPPDGRVGPYRILGELGRGGMGVVYRAERADGGGQVALKWMLHGARDHERRFRKEIAALARLDHPTLVPVRDVGEHEGRLYYTMDLVDGPDLAAFLRERGLVSAEVAIAWGIELARALAYAHRQGIVHRDVKPGNVLLEGGRRVRLVDFGLARELVDAPTLTRAGEVLGTPRYMAPEQARGLPAGPAADIYALGAVLYEVLSGRPFVTGEHADQVRHRLQRGDGARLDHVAAGVPADLALVVHKALALDPADRYADMDAFADDLARVRAGGRAVDARPSLAARLRRGLRRHRERLLVAAAVVAVVAIAAGVRGGLSSREASRREEAADSRLAIVEETERAALAAGDADAAERAFRGFLELPENQGTRAIARAWLARAERLSGLDEGDAHRDALARAWSAATSDAEADEALVGLAASLARRHDFDGLGAAVQTMRARGVSTDTSRALEAAWDYSRRDFAAGARLDRREGVAPLLAALSRATQTSPDLALVGDLDVDGDGRPEVLVQEDGRRLALAASGDLALEHRRALPLPGARHGGFPRALPYSAEAPLVLVWDTREAALYDLAGGAARELAHGPESQYKPAALADLDGDGIREVLVGTRAPGRHLVSVAPDAGGTWHVASPHPASNEQNSAFVGLGWGDFDGDGRPELWQARGAFGAYDVRMLGRAADGALALLGRRKLGDVQDGSVLRGPGGRSRMVVVRADVWPSRSGMPPEQPFGEPRGIYVLDWTGERFDTAWYRPTESECIDTAVADLDGDGLDDFAVNCGEEMVVVRQLADGGFVDVPVAHATLVGAADVDGDGDRELELTEPDGPAWIVGAGDAHLPTLPAPAESAATVGEPALARAEDLVRMGLVAEGVRALEDEAVQAPAGEARARLRLRIGELQERMGRTDLAAESYLAAVDAAPLKVEALRGAARCFEAELLPERALAAVDALLAGGEELDAKARDELQATRARLAAHVAAPSVVLDFKDGLPEVLDVHDPLQAWHDPVEGALRVRQADDGVVARVPITWDGRWLQLELDLTLERFEWAARLYVQVEPAAGGRDAWGAQVRSVGGAGNITTAPGCSLTTDTPPALGWIPRDGPHWGDRVTVRVGVDADAGWGACTWEGLPERFQARQALKPAPPPGDYVLVIRGQAREGISLADAAVHRILVRGATVRAEPAERWPEARRALATQRPADALTALAGAEGPEAELLRTFAVDELGRWAEADRRFAALARGEGVALVRQRAPVLLRARGERFVARVREASGAAWPGLLWAAWGPSVQHHPDDDGWQAALERDLGTVDGFPPSPELLSLLVARGRAWRIAGRLPLAEQDLERARTLAAELGPGSDVAGQLSTALLELAAVRVAQGGRDEALALVEASIARAPAPEVSADIALHRAELAPLHALPGWARVRAATRIP